MSRISLISKIRRLFSRRAESNSSTGVGVEAARSSNLDDCGNCGSSLPLRYPRAGETGSHWQCAQCGYRYYAVMDEECDAASLANVRVRQVHLNTDQLRHPERCVPEFVNGMHFDRERRAARRQALETNVLVTPVNEYCLPIGEPFLARTVDFSTSGISIVHHEPIDAKWLVVEHLSANGQSSQVVINIARTIADGEEFRIGGAFVKPDTETHRLGIAPPVEATG